MNKGEIWSIFSNAYAKAFEPGVIDNVNDATSQGNLDGAMACYEAGRRAADSEAAVSATMIRNEALEDARLAIIHEASGWQKQNEHVLANALCAVAVTVQCLKINVAPRSGGSDSTSSLHSSPVAGHCEEAAPSSVRLDAVAVAKICKSGDPHGCGYPDCDCVRHSQRSAEYVHDERKL